MKKIYLISAIIGAVVPYLFFIPFIQQHGVNLPLFIQSLFANGAAGGFSADLLITSFVFWCFMFQARQRANGPSPWVFIVLNLTVGLSCAFPAWLYWRERNISETSSVAG